MRLSFPAGLALVMADPALAQDRRPDTGFFTGVYEMVGKSISQPPALLDDLVHIQPAPEGWGLLVYSCAPGAQPDGWPLELRPGTFEEVPNILQEIDGPSEVWCQYFTDHSNYPILPCQSAMGARFTLWPITDARMTACLTAAGQPLPGSE